MLKGTLEGCVLAIIGMKETYGYEISEQLEAHGFGRVAEGTIYPLLLRPEKGGLISATYKASELGPKRKYYVLTEKGGLALRRAWETDRRTREVCLTGEGRAAARALSEALRRFERRAFAMLPPEEQHALVEASCRLQQSMAAALDGLYAALDAGCRRHLEGMTLLEFEASLPEADEPAP